MEMENVKEKLDTLGTEKGKSIDEGELTEPYMYMDIFFVVTKRKFILPFV